MRIPWKALGIGTVGLVTAGAIFTAVGFGFENTIKDKQIDILEYQLGVAGMKPLPIYHD